MIKNSFDIFQGKWSNSITQQNELYNTYDLSLEKNCTYLNDSILADNEALPEFTKKLFSNYQCCYKMSFNENNFPNQSNAYNSFKNNKTIINSIEKLSRDQKIWTKDEESILLVIYNNLGITNWKKISKLIKTKTPQQCQYKYHKLNLINSNLIWTKKEDINLLELIEIYGYDWVMLSEKMNKPISIIKDRYNIKLNPLLNRSKFTEDEDRQIIEHYKNFSNNWNEISKKFPFRNASMIKNRFYSVLRKKYEVELKKINYRDKLIKKKIFEIEDINHDEIKSNPSEKNGCSSNLFEKQSLNMNNENLIEFEKDNQNIDIICNQYHRNDQDEFDVKYFFDASRDFDYGNEKKENTTDNVKFCIFDKKKLFQKYDEMKNNLSIISNEIFINKAENSNCENFNRKYYLLLQELILISGEYNQNFTKYSEKHVNIVIRQCEILINLIKTLNAKLNTMK